MRYMASSLLGQSAHVLAPSAIGRAVPGQTGTACPIIVRLLPHGMRVLADGNMPLEWLGPIADCMYTSFITECRMHPQQSTLGTADWAHQSSMH